MKHHSTTSDSGNWTSHFFNSLSRVSKVTLIPELCYSESKVTALLTTPMQSCHTVNQTFLATMSCLYLHLVTWQNHLLPTPAPGEKIGKERRFPQNLVSTLCGSRGTAPDQRKKVGGRGPWPNLRKHHLALL